MVVFPDGKEMRLRDLTRGSFFILSERVTPEFDRRAVLQVLDQEDFAGRGEIVAKYRERVLPKSLVDATPGFNSTDRDAYSVAWGDSFYKQTFRGCKPRNTTVADRQDALPVSRCACCSREQQPPVPHPPPPQL